MKRGRPAGPPRHACRPPAATGAPHSESLPAADDKAGNGFVSATTQGLSSSVALPSALARENTASFEGPSSGVALPTYKSAMPDASMPQPTNAVPPLPGASEWNPDPAECAGHGIALRDGAGRAHTQAPPPRWSGADGFSDLMTAVAARRDRAAFAALFDHFAPRVKAYTLRHGCDAGTAEELAQEVMLAVWRRAASFDARQASVCTWIFIIARNRCIDWLRREQRPGQLVAEAELIARKTLAADDSMAEAEREARLQRAVTALPLSEAELLHLAYFEGKTHCEIAEARHLPLGTVKARLRRALLRLRQTLQNDI